MIHPTFPVLAGTKARVDSLISQCPPALQEAFCTAFLDLLQPFLPSASQTDGEIPASYHSLSQWESEGHQPSSVTNLVFLQTLVMIAIDLDHKGGAAAKEQLGGTLKLMILGKAAGLGYAMRLHLAAPDPIPGPELDPDSDANVMLRAWWMLVVLDRWNAIGTGSPAVINNDMLMILPGLRYIMGDVVYQLISKIPLEFVFLSLFSGILIRSRTFAHSRPLYSASQ